MLPIFRYTAAELEEILQNCPRLCGPEVDGSWKMLEISIEDQTYLLIHVRNCKDTYISQISLECKGKSWGYRWKSEVGLFSSAFWSQGSKCQNNQAARATFHHNRFSCQVPASISNISDVHATVVMGNMVGHGRELNASWIPPAENQAFLFYSPKIWSTHVSLSS